MEEAGHRKRMLELARKLNLEIEPKPGPRWNRWTKTGVLESIRVFFRGLADSHFHNFLLRDSYYSTLSFECSVLQCYALYAALVKASEEIAHSLHPGDER
jgi:hypothetical protein